MNIQNKPEQKIIISFTRAEIVLFCKLVALGLDYGYKIEKEDENLLFRSILVETISPAIKQISETEIDLQEIIKIGFTSRYIEIISKYIVMLKGHTLCYGDNASNSVFELASDKFMVANTFSMMINKK